MLSQQEVGGGEPWPWSIWDRDNRWVAHLSVLTCEMGMSQPHPWKQKGGDQEGQEGGPQQLAPSPTACQSWPLAFMCQAGDYQCL